MDIKRQFEASLERSNIPAPMKGAVSRYILKGIPPGHFLEAVICNDLRGAFARADEENKPRLEDYLALLYNDVPAPAWGSHKNYVAWLERGGLGNG